MMPEEAMTHISIEQTKIDVPQDANLGFANGEASGNTIDKVKELLFGTQSREYERRFARLEDRLNQEYAQLRQETRQQFDSIRQLIQQEINALATALRSEQADRDEVLRQIDNAYKTTTLALEKRVDQIETETNQRQRELRQQLLAQSKTLDDEIRQKYQELLAILERRTQDLRSEKTDRAALASLFREMALRVNQQDSTDS